MKPTKEGKKGEKKKETNKYVGKGKKDHKHVKEVIVKKDIDKKSGSKVPVA